MTFIKFIVNWIAMLTLPIWGGAFFLAVFIWEAFIERAAFAVQIASGDRWFWK